VGIGSIAGSAAYYANLRDCTSSSEGEAVEAANIAPIVVTVAAWARPNLKSSAAVVYGFRLNKMLEANRRQSSIRRMNVCGTIALGTKPMVTAIAGSTSTNSISAA
jgi:hypothetical protein